jgi:hypothetical protein
LCHVEGQMPGSTHRYSCIANWVPLHACGHYAMAEWCGQGQLTSPMLVEYTTFMRVVDVTYQLRASYSSQSRSHKW